MRRIRKRCLSVILIMILFITAVFPSAVYAEASPLTLTGAEVIPGGGVELTFDRTVSSENLLTLVQTGFTIEGLDRTLTIANAVLYGSSLNKIRLSFVTPVYGGEAVTLRCTSGSVQAADGGRLGAISSMDIVNNLPHPTLIPGTPPPLVVGVPFSHMLGASGGTAPYRFLLDSGTLPTGLTLGVNGAVSGTPAQSGVFSFAICIKDAADALYLQAFNLLVQNPPSEICEIAGVGYQTLDEALRNVQSGETIRLLKNIDYDGGIEINGKKITFDLNGYTLNVVNKTANGSGLLVLSGGAVDLVGDGALHVTGEANGVRVTTGGAITSATVTSATASGYYGEAAYAAGDNAFLTVTEDCTAVRSLSICVHAISRAEIHVGGNVTAWNQGVYASSSRIYVSGNVSAKGYDGLEEPIGIGIGSYDGEVEIGGEVIANRTGVMTRANGTVMVDGVITAPGYIQLADDEPLTPSDYIAQTTKKGYRTYTAGNAGTVWVKEVPVRYPVEVNGSFAPVTGAGSYTEGTAVQLHAGVKPGCVFADWISDDVSVADPASADTGFIMPAKAVSVEARWTAAEPDEPDPGTPDHPDPSVLSFAELREGNTLRAGQRVALASASGASPADASESNAEMDYFDYGGVINLDAAAENAVLRDRLKAGTEYTVRTWTDAVRRLTYTVWHVFKIEEGDGGGSFVFLTHNPIWNISFHPNGGNCTVSSAYTDENGRLPALPVPKKDGCIFAGWFTGETGGAEVTASTVFEKTDTVYAHWTQNPVGADRVKTGSDGSGSDSYTGTANVSGTWIRVGTGWKFRKTDETPVKNTWIRTDGRWYRFDRNGYAQTGWILDGGRWYHCNTLSCAMDTGWYKSTEDGNWYYLHADGSMAAGWVMVDGIWYYFYNIPTAAAYSFDPVTQVWSWNKTDVQPFGAMQKNTITQEGYILGESGAWIG